MGREIAVATVLQWVLQCVAVCCSVLQCVAKCCNAIKNSTLLRGGKTHNHHCYSKQVAVYCCSVLQCVAKCTIAKVSKLQPKQIVTCLRSISSHVGDGAQRCFEAGAAVCMVCMSCALLPQTEWQQRWDVPSVSLSLQV